MAGVQVWFGRLRWKRDSESSSVLPQLHRHRRAVWGRLVAGPEALAFAPARHHKWIGNADDYALEIGYPDLRSVDSGWRLLTPVVRISTSDVSITFSCFRAASFASGVERLIAER